MHKTFLRRKSLMESVCDRSTWSDHTRGSKPQCHRERHCTCVEVCETGIHGVFLLTHTHAHTGENGVCAFKAPDCLSLCAAQRVRHRDRDRDALWTQRTVELQLNTILDKFKEKNKLGASRRKGTSREVVSIIVVSFSCHPGVALWFSLLLLERRKVLGFGDEEKGEAERRWWRSQKSSSCFHCENTAHGTDGGDKCGL